jgi:hypothetical protein
VERPSGSASSATHGKLGNSRGQLAYVETCDCGVWRGNYVVDHIVFVAYWMASLCQNTHLSSRFGGRLETILASFKAVH